MPNRKTHEEFVRDVDRLVGDEYDVIGHYILSSIKIRMRHNKCSTIYEVKPAKFLFGNRCPECEPSRKKTHERFVKQVDELTLGEYTVVGKYAGDSSHVDVKHNECGNVFSVKANNLLNGKGCPNCKSSKGEQKIARLLNSKGIVFKRQYRIHDCRNMYPLPFDFAVFNDGELSFLIEYQGQQHYGPIPIFGGEEGFNNCIRNDDIKRQYCVDNNIRLIEIPYHRFNEIDKIIGEVLNYENGRVLCRSNRLAFKA